MDNEDLQELALYEKSLTTKSGKRLDGLRGKFSSLAYRIAPEYYCPEGEGCHVCAPNGNCLYEEGIEERWPEEFGFWNDEIKTYKDTMGFCGFLLYFLCFVGKNLKEGKAHNLEEHFCGDWQMRYLDVDRTPDWYNRCIICGKEFEQ
jgi:hypothetical protein